MKRQIANLLGVLSLLLVAACASAQTVAKVNVPFGFVVNKATLPAGAYRIDSVSNTSSTPILALRSEDARVAMLIMGNHATSAEPSENSRLVFRRYGDQYFLSQIWMAGETSGHELPISRREAELAKNQQPSEDVIVLASLR